jgi:hypothetical protein
MADEIISRNLTGLQPGQCYTVQVQSKNADGEASEWSNFYTFCVPADPLITENSTTMEYLSGSAGIYIKNLAGTNDAMRLNASGLYFYDTGNVQTVGINALDGSASFTGTIYAGSGSIGGWTIQPNRLYSGLVNLDATPGNQKIYIGTGNYTNTNTPFYVDNLGQLSLSNQLFFSPAASTNSGDFSQLTVVGKIRGAVENVELIGNNKLFNTTTSIEINSSSVAKIVTASNNLFLTGENVIISGLTGNSQVANGVFTIQSVTASSFSITLTSPFVAGTYSTTSGSISLRELTLGLHPSENGGLTNSMVTRTNLVSNPSFETNTSGWAPFIGTTASVTRDTSKYYIGAAAGKISWPTASSTQSIYTTISTIVGQTYTISAYVYVPSGNPDVRIDAFSLPSATVSAKDEWVRVSCSFVATGTTTFVGIASPSTTLGNIAYFDAFLAEKTNSLGSYIEGTVTSEVTYGHDQGIGLRLDPYNWWFTNNQFRVGTSGNYMKYDGSTLKLGGTGTYTLGMSVGNQDSENYFAIYNPNLLAGGYSDIYSDSYDFYATITPPAYNNVGTPFYVDATGKFSLGESLTWNPTSSALSVRGSINAISGSIGGFAIQSNSINNSAQSSNLFSAFDPSMEAGAFLTYWNASATISNTNDSGGTVGDSGIVYVSQSFSGENVADGGAHSMALTYDWMANDVLTASSTEVYTKLISASDLSITSGSNYAWSAYVQSASGTRSMALKTYFYNSSSALISSSATTISVSTTGTTFSSSFTAPASLQYLRFGFLDGSLSTASSTVLSSRQDIFYVDTIQLNAGTSALTYSTGNGIQITGDSSVNSGKMLTAGPVNVSGSIVNATNVKSDGSIETQSVSTPLISMSGNSTGIDFYTSGDLTTDAKIYVTGGTASANKGTLLISSKNFYVSSNEITGDVVNWKDATKFSTSEWIVSSSTGNATWSTRCQYIKMGNSVRARYRARITASASVTTAGILTVRFPITPIDPTTVGNIVHSAMLGTGLYYNLGNAPAVAVTPTWLNTTNFQVLVPNSSSTVRLFTWTGTQTPGGFTQAAADEWYFDITYRVSG